MFFVFPNPPGEAGVVRFPVGHGGGGVRGADRRRLHADCGGKQHEHPRLRHRPAARQSLQRPLLSEVRVSPSIIQLYAGVHQDEAQTVAQPGVPVSA